MVTENSHIEWKLFQTGDTKLCDVQLNSQDNLIWGILLHAETPNILRTQKPLSCNIHLH